MPSDMTPERVKMITDSMLDGCRSDYERDEVQRLAKYIEHLTARIADLEDYVDGQDDPDSVGSTAWLARRMEERALKAEQRIEALESQHAGTEGPIPEEELGDDVEYVLWSEVFACHFIGKWLGSHYRWWPSTMPKDAIPIRKLTPRAAADNTKGSI